MSIVAPTSFFSQRLPGSRPVDASSATYVANLVAQLEAEGGSFNFREFAQTHWIADALTPTQKVWLDVKDGTGTTKREAIEHVPIPWAMRPPPPFPGDNAMTIWDRPNDRLYEFHGMRYHGVDAVRVVEGCTTLEEPGWHCDDVAVYNEISKNPGYFEAGISYPGSTNWGISGSGIALWPGAITIAEARALYIPHAIRIGCKTRQKTFRWPAQKADGTSEDATAPMEGMIFAFPSNYNVNEKVTDPFLRAVCVAARDFGFVLTDGTGSGLAIKCQTDATTPYSQTLRPDAWKGPEDKFGGKEAILTETASALLKKIPWADLQVVDASYRPSSIAPGMLPVGH